MNEENSENSNEITPAGLSFSFNEESGEVQIEFADGLQIIPPDVVVLSGGVEKLKEIAPALREVNFGDFLREFEREKQRQALNNFQQRFIGGHFARKTF